MSLKNIARVNKEIEDLNNDPSLRTVIQQDPNDRVGVYYFTMVPNDGPMSGLPIVGRMFITSEYPTNPPVLNVYTNTGRYNVDVYSCYRNSDSHSSLCFDILRPSSDPNSVWKSDYTVSCLFASLMQSLVCFDVPQDYGGTQPEYVAMEKLAGLKKTTVSTYDFYRKKGLVPEIPDYGKVPAKKVRCGNFVLPLTMQTVSPSYNSYNGRTFGQQKLFTSRPFKLSDSLTVNLDVTELAKNPYVVFSVILSNAPNDPVGRKRGTILIRDGVTATAAKKVRHGATKWFYHGTPMNEGMSRFNVTIHNNQFTMSYLDNESGQMVVFGDSVVSFLREKELKANQDNFYLTIFLKNKQGQNIQIKNLNLNEGFVHPNNYVEGVDDLTESVEKLSLNNKKAWFTNRSNAKSATSSGGSAKQRLPVYIGLEVNQEGSIILDYKLKEILGYDYKRYGESKCNGSNNGHLTLTYYKSFSDLESWMSFISENYQEGDSRKVNVIGFAKDPNCVAFIVQTDEKTVFLPKEKKLYITGLLERKPTTYSGQLLDNVLNEDLNPKEGCDDSVVFFENPIEIDSIVRYYGNLRKNSFKRK